MATPFFLILQASCVVPKLAQLVAQACEQESCQDVSSILQLQARRSGLTCPHGEEEYTFAEWAPGLYRVGDVPDNGITITNFAADDPSCQQPAILSEVNSGGLRGDILACNCHALVVAEDGSTNESLGICDHKYTRFQPVPPEIELTFDEPQDILEVTFYNVQGYGWSFLTYTTSAEETVAVRAPAEGRYNPSVVDLRNQEVQPKNVKVIKVFLADRAAFTGMKLCKRGGSLVGDPHIRTQDHAHYTVLNEGNFLAWRFHPHTEVLDKSGLKMEVDWQIYAHYSAHGRSWTRGLLLVDKSVGSRQLSLELTSEECQLRKHMDGTWSPIESELLHVEGSLTGFNITQLNEGHSIHFDSKKIWSPKGKKARWDAKLLMTTKRGRQPIATVQLRCFPGRHIGMQIIRERMGDARFMGGQLGRHAVQLKREKNGLGHWFNTSSDEQFQASKEWQDLGGSFEAASYLELEDRKANSTVLGGGNPSCPGAQTEKAAG